MSFFFGSAQADALLFLLVLRVSLMSRQVRRLHGFNLESFAQSGNAFILVGLLPGAVVAFARQIRQMRLRVRGDNAFVVSQDHLVRRLGDYVLRLYRRLSAASRSVDNKGRYAVSGSMSSQTLDNLDALGNGGSEVLDADGQVADVDVVRSDSVRVPGLS